MPTLRTSVLALACVATAACAGDRGATDDEAAVTTSHAGRLVELLASGRPVFGIFSGEHTSEGGALMAENRETDFVFYSLESGPFDIPAMLAYMRGMAEASGPEGPHPVTLRIPPIREDRDAAAEHVRQGLAAGVAGIVFPHVESVEDARLAVELMGDRSWPSNPDGDLVNILLLEDRVAVRDAREIVGTPGVGVAIPGPGDLRRAYEGDMDAVEGAIQTVLSACKELGVPCGITAGPDDIARRLEEGFRLIIVTDPEALSVGRAAAGR